MKKIFKQVQSAQNAPIARKSSNTQQEASLGNAAASPKSTEQQQEANLATNLPETDVKSEVDRNMLAQMQGYNKGFELTQKAIKNNLEVLSQLKEKSDAASLSIYKDVCSNIDYVVKFVGVPQIEQYYEAIYRQYIDLLNFCNDIKSYFSQIQVNIQKILNENPELKNLQSIDKNVSGTQEKKASIFKSNYRKAAEESAPSTSGTTQGNKGQPTIEKALLEAVSKFIDTLIQINQIELNYQFFISEYELFNQTKNVAMEFRNTMMTICNAKAQYDADEQDFGTGTREDLLTITNLYPVAIGYAKNFNRIVMSNLPQIQTMPTVEMSLLTGQPLLKRNKNNQLVPVKNTVYQFEKNKNDQRNKILQNQLNYLVRTMEIDSRKYMLKPFKSLFGRGK